MSSASTGMPSYAEDDLISLADSIGESNVVASAVSPTTVGYFSSGMATNHRTPIQRDSFSNLTGLMKAKKPYMPLPPPPPRSPLMFATNSMHYASRVANGNSMVSPLARPYHTDGSVAAYLQDQASSPTKVTPLTPEYRQGDMRRLESLLQEIKEHPIDDDDNEPIQYYAPPQTTTIAEPLLPGFDFNAALPMRTGLTTPPTPTKFTQSLSSNEPVVRVTMHVWDTMGRELDKLKDEKRKLEVKASRLENLVRSPNHVGDYSDELHTQIGKLQYQNEVNKTQKAMMARSLSEKDLQIKRLQLEVGSLKENLETTASAAKDYSDVVAQRDYRVTMQNDREANKRLVADLTTTTKDREIKTLKDKLNNIQEALTQSIAERDAAVRAQTNAGDYNARTQKLADQLTQREKLHRVTQEQYAAEHTKVGELEDHLDGLRRKLNQVGDLQGKLREKTSECDHFRTKLKHQEKIVEDSQQRIIRASNNGSSLRGAAHLVKPQINSKLPALVLGCSECYAKNIACDNKARCRSCTENNEACARWRCSLKHVLGQCPDVPCHLPHDHQGWLLQVEPRPQW